MKMLSYNNGDNMPIFGLGTWKSNPGDVYSAVKEALRIGYRHIDCAPIYGNEAEVGQALSESFASGVVKREDIWVTSKLWNNAHARIDVQPALEKTLADLRLDYLDLYLIHWPVAFKKEVLFNKSAKDLVSLDDLPVAETWQGMEEMLGKQLTRHIGVSNFSVPKLKSLIDTAEIGPEMNQIELHPYLQQPDMVNFCKDNKVHLTAYSPLGSADRPAQLKDEDEPVLLKDTVVVDIAARLNCSAAQVLIAWAMHRGTAVIPKSVNPERIAQNLAAADLVLSSDDVAAIASLDRNRRYVSGGFWVMEGGPYTLANLWDE